MALGDAEPDENGVLDLHLPHSALISLRGPKSSTPKIVRWHDGDQTLEHEIRVLSMQALSVNELLMQELLLLLPFFLYTLQEDVRQLADDPEEVRRIAAEFRDICQRLDKLNEEGSIDTYEQQVLLELMRKVTRNIAPKSILAEEIDEMANSQILKLEAVEIFEVGAKAGEKRGEARGEKRGEKRGEQTGRAAMARDFAKRLFMDGMEEEHVRRLCPEVPADQLDSIKLAALEEKKQAKAALN